MDKNGSYTLTEESIKEFKEKEAKMTPEERRAASKGLVEANTRANDIAREIDGHITNVSKLIDVLSRFLLFVQEMDGHSGFISFRDSNGFLGREEDYKTLIAEEARKELRFGDWNESWIGTGKIADCTSRAMSKAGNLVNKNQQIDFKNRLNPDHEKYREDAEQVLFDIYRNPVCDSSVAFTNAVKTFGAKYDTIAFLFFIKDDTRFLPISTGHFDKGFAALGIDYTTSYNCSWENYLGFIEIIREIQSVMEDVLPMQGAPRLIDAHSFVWVIQQDRFLNWIPNADQGIQIEQAAEEYIQRVVTGNGGRRSINTNVFKRSVEVVKEARKRANGICQLCNQPAPFSDRNGNPYLEVHHVKWLSQGGEDSTSNTVALCPNCHTRMHILDDPEDIEKLKSILKS